MRFPVSHPRHLLSKAKRELDKLKVEANGERGEPDPNAIADLTINAAWSLWHVTDWIGNSNDPAVSDIVPARINKVERERTDAFQKQLRAESKDLTICWALALHFKHFEFEESSRARGVLQQNERPSLSAVEAAPSLSPAPEPLDASAVGSMLRPIATLHPKVTVNGERLRVVDVYTRSYEYLDKLLKKHGM